MHIPEIRCAPPRNWGDAFDLIAFVGATKVVPSLEEQDVEWNMVDKKFPSRCGDMKLYGHHFKGMDPEDYRAL